MAQGTQARPTKAPAADGNGSQAKGQGNKPVEIRLGRIKAVIWTNQGDNGPWYNIQFRRIYRDESGWQTSDSFGRDDLPLLAKVSDRAHTWCYQQQAAAKKDAPSDEDPGSENPDHIPF
jgi:hypothetical protein